MDWLGCHVFYTYRYRHIHSESDLIRHPYISITWNITLLSKRIYKPFVIPFRSNYCIGIDCVYFVHERVIIRDALSPLTAQTQVNIDCRLHPHSTHTLLQTLALLHIYIIWYFMIFLLWGSTAFYFCLVKENHVPEPWTKLLILSLFPLYQKYLDMQSCVFVQRYWRALA